MLSRNVSSRMFNRRCPELLILAACAMLLDERMTELIFDSSQPLRKASNLSIYRSHKRQRSDNQIAGSARGWNQYAPDGSAVVPKPIDHRMLGCGARIHP